MNLQYGCGKSVPIDWINFDVSPNLRLEKIPVIGKLFIKKKWGAFPKNVRYGNIVKGLSGISNDSCDSVYCSHVLEHMAYNEMKLALKNTYDILKSGGTFRLIVPNMEECIKQYLEAKENHDPLACHKFIENTLMGLKHTPVGIKEKINAQFGNSHHLWNYDYDSMKFELEKVGFKNIRRAYFNDSANKAFLTVEDENRFMGALAIECCK